MSPERGIEAIGDSRNSAVILDGHPEIVGVVPLELGITIDQIPDARCIACSAPTNKATLRFEVPFEHHGKRLLAVAEQVPGYSCEGCELETYNIGASVQALSAALAVVRDACDQTTAERLEASLAAGRQQLALSHSRSL